MGNKTRNVHNTRGSNKQPRPIFQRIEPTPPAAPPAKLEFPFHPVDALTVALGSGIPGYREVLKACPPEFKYGNKWCNLANDIFFGGARTSSWKWRTPSLKTQQLAYLRACLVRRKDE